MGEFACLSLSPISLSEPRIAFATARAGGVGILDAQFCPESGLPKARADLEGLVALAGNDAAFGLRLGAGQARSHGDVLLEALAGRPHWVILCDWSASTLPAAVNGLPAARTRRLLVEVTSAGELRALEGLGVAIDGLVAKGHESGGWVGEDSAFVLSQKLIRDGNAPVYVQGGISVGTAAACRAGGAAGVIVDDTLLLLPEFPLPESWREQLKSISPQDTIALGEHLGASLRVAVHPRLAAAIKLKNMADALELESDEPSQWRQRAASLVGWSDSDMTAWPVGQGIGLASRVRERHGTTRRYIQSILRESARQVRASRHLGALQEGGPLARSMGTRYPIIQGPMTRVSDTARFADTVSRAGALPMMALALMNADSVTKLLKETRDLLGDRPWGVGILGFVPLELRQEQLRAALAVGPSFALIAGGRPDQAAALEKEGVATFLHVPTPGLAKLFVEQGARRLVFEGRECGGHVGPLNSFALWEGVVETLLECLPVKGPEPLQLVFAGGIHDARSASMVAALAAPLSERGVEIGVLMGSAYLFTREAVETGAILQGFQDQALACIETVNLESGPGHASRCAVTPFAREFQQTRRELLQSGVDRGDVRSRLDRLCLGRLRVASKGRDRNGQEILAVDTRDQLTRGMYMLGQVATMRETIVKMEDLHADVCSPSKAEPDELKDIEEIEAAAAAPSNIAVVGIGTLLPGANSHDRYWENILAMRDLVSEVPPARWDWREYFDSEPSTPDKVYSRWGCFLDPLPFNPLRYGIPPCSLASIDANQLLALETVGRALEDAGCLEHGFDRENTSVILGLSGGIAELGQAYVARAFLTGGTTSADPETLKTLPEWTEDSFAGVLPNVCAGRVANQFDLGGSSFTVDSACSSSLTAVDLAVRELESGRSNMAVAGGVDTMNSAFVYLCFCKTHALSPHGQLRTFDSKADGTLLGEGVLAVVLKRLADAERDGDRIYGVIRSVASSSDGKGLGLTAPCSKGQRRALRRAYRKAGFSPGTLGLYEAHGTGTVAGDRTELRTIKGVLREGGAAAKSCVVGSVKALIGHTKSTAGIAGLVKCLLALHYRVLPPQPNVDTPLRDLNDTEAPMYLLTEARPWLRHPEYPRRAGVSAFGFGGTNCHAVLEEYRGAMRSVADGAAQWPWELVLLAGADRDQLIAEIDQLVARLDVEARPELRDLAYSCALRVETAPKARSRLALVVSDSNNLLDSLRQARAHLVSRDPATLPPTIHLTEWEDGHDVHDAGQVALLFPGQGAQYPGMAREVCLYFEEMREALEAADASLNGSTPRLLSQYILPPSPFSDEARAAAQLELTRTEVAQPAIGAVEVGFLALLRRLGVEATMVAGHSYGEYVALHAAGVFSRDQLFRLSRLRGEAMASACAHADGAMAAVRAPREATEKLLVGSGVVVANHNAPDQTVISGERGAVKQIVKRMLDEGMRASLLPVAGAFHSPLMASAKVALQQAVDETPIESPTISVFSNATAHCYGAEPELIRTQLSGQLLEPVEFCREVDSMYSAGARVFIEAGPKTILSGLVDRILGDRPHVTASLDGAGGLRGFLIALAKLHCLGTPWQPSTLFQDRECRVVTVPDLQMPAGESAVAAAGWVIADGRVRPREAATETDKNRHLGPPPTHEVPSTAAPKASFPGASRTMRTDTMSNSKSPDSAIPTPRDTGVPTAPLKIPATTEFAAVEVYREYQQTMRQFLALQEQVVARFVSGAALSDADLLPRAAPAMPTDAVTETIVESAAVVHAPREQADASAAPSANDDRDESASPDLERGAILSMVIDVVSDRTGYPVEMLNADQDIEAELGIDSIKRVEILAELERKLPPPLVAAMGGEIEGLTRVKTLSGLVDALLEQASAETSKNRSSDDSPSTVVTEPTALIGGEHIDRESLLAMLVDVVSDRTGYPPEMLGAEQDLEAELGIDSIKRLEILAVMEQRLPPTLSAMMGERTETFSQVKTLAGLVDTLIDAVASADRGAAGPQPVSDAPVEESATESPDGLAVDGTDTAEAISAPSPEELATVATVGRYTTQPSMAPLEEAASLRREGWYLIAGDDLGVAPYLSEHFSTAGIDTAVIEQSSLASAEEIEKVVTRLRSERGPVAGVIHLAGLGEASLPEDYTDWRRLIAIHSKSLFHLLRYCGEDLRSGGGVVLAASLMGGHFGRNGDFGPGLPTAGSHTGLLKTLALEWPDVAVTAMDLDRVPASEIAARVTRELGAMNGVSEVGYRDGQRVIFEGGSASLAEATDMPIVPDGDWVVLALGGARGITAEIVHELLVPGMTLVLVGRTELPETSVTEATEVEDDLAVLRQRLIREAKAAGRLPTPVVIERRVAQVIRERDIQANVAAFNAAGARVEYHAVDVTSPTPFVRLLDDLYRRHGRIDAVIQGAGIIEDKLIEDKSSESFERVFDTKVDSTYLLCRHLRPESLKLMLFMASVAGRTGNRGQADYAAANEVMNRFAWWMHSRWPHTRVMSINWGPWDTTGMASEGAKKQFRERGVIPIPVASGRRFVRDELRYGRTNDVELVAGIFDTQRAAVESKDTEKQRIVSLPLIDGSSVVQRNGSLTLTYGFDPAAPYLRDHRVDGKLVVPAAFAMELMAECVQVGWPEWTVTEVRSLCVLRGIVLNGEDCLNVSIETHPIAQTNDELSVQVRILNDLGDIVYYRADIVSRREARVEESLELAPISDGRAMDSDEIYGVHCFHGPAFQHLVIDHIGESGVAATITQSSPAQLLGDPQAQGEWLFDPVSFDCAMQSILVWARLYLDSYALPSEFGMVRRNGRCASEVLQFRSQVQLIDRARFSADMVLMDSDGTTRLEMRQIVAVHGNQFTRLAPVRHTTESLLADAERR